MQPRDDRGRQLASASGSRERSHLLLELHGFGCPNSGRQKRVVVLDVNRLKFDVNCRKLNVKETPNERCWPKTRRNQCLNRLDLFAASHCTAVTSGVFANTTCLFTATFFSLRTNQIAPAAE